MVSCLELLPTDILNAIASNLDIKSLLTLNKISPIMTRFCDDNLESLLRKNNFPLLSLTRKPLIYNTFNYGGNDLLGHYESFIDDTDPCFKESMDIRTRYHKVNNGDNLRIQRIIEEEYKDYISKVQNRAQKAERGNLSSQKLKLAESVLRNERQRLKLIEALGGHEFCKTIPVIYPQIICEYMNFHISDIPNGEVIVQYEDMSGRKGVIMKLKHKVTGKHELICMFQRYRETCYSSFNDGGGLWLSNGIYNMSNIDDIVGFLREIKMKTHPVYELSD